VPAVSNLKVRTVHEDMTVQNLKTKKEEFPWKYGNYILIGITSLRNKSSTLLPRNQHAQNSIPYFFKTVAYPPPSFTHEWWGASASMATAYLNPTRHRHYYLHQYSIFLIHCRIRSSTSCTMNMSWESQVWCD
jgi:hypothetical protein